MKVLSEKNNSALLTINHGQTSISANIFPITFQVCEDIQCIEHHVSSVDVADVLQNQESIPTQGLVQSYYMTVDYVTDPYNLFASSLG
jgi:hypothetical protein